MGLQLATIIAVYAQWDFARIKGIGWEWGGAIWVYSIVTYIPLDILKFIIRSALAHPTDNKVCVYVTHSRTFINTSKIKDLG